MECPPLSAIMGVRQVIRGSPEYRGHGPGNKGIYLHTEVPKPVEMLDVRWGWTHIVGRKTGDTIAGFTRFRFTAIGYYLSSLYHFPAQKSLLFALSMKPSIVPFDPILAFIVPSLATVYLPPSLKSTRIRGTRSIRLRLLTRSLGVRSRGPSP